MISGTAWNTFLYALSITGKGMLGIFIFMGIFYGIIKLLDVVFPQQIEREEK